MNFLKDFFKCLINPDVWVFFSHKKIALKYKDTIIGPFWNVASSIFLISILSLSFFIFLNPEDFTSFVYRLSISVFFWIFVSTVLNESTMILESKTDLLNEKRIDVKNFIFENIYTNFIIFLHSFPIIFVLFFISDFKFQMNIIFTFLGLIVVIINLLLISYLVSIISVIYKDVKKIVENLVYAFFFATPVIWSENMVSEKIQNLLIFNPFYHFTVLFRNPLMNNIDEKFYQSFFICLLLMIVVFFISLKIFKYFERKIVLYL